MESYIGRLVKCAFMNLYISHLHWAVQYNLFEYAQLISLLIPSQNKIYKVEFRTN